MLRFVSASSLDTVGLDMVSLIGSFPVGLAFLLLDGEAADSYSAMTSAFLFRMHWIWVRPTPNFAASSLDDCPFSPSLITSTRSDKVRAFLLEAISKCVMLRLQKNLFSLPSTFSEW